MALKEVLARFQINVDDRKLKASNTTIDQSMGRLKQFALAAATAFALHGAKRFLTQMIQMGDEIGKTARQIGLTGDQLERLRFAADRSGIDSRAFTSSLQRLQRAAAEAQGGNRLYREEFDRLGVSLRDGNGELNTVDNLIRQVANGTQGMGNSTQRTATLMTLMGRSGARMAPLLMEGAAGIEALTARFDELTGGGFGDGFVENAEAAQDAITDFELVMTFFRAKLANAVIPALTSFLSTMSTIVGKVSQSETAMFAVKAVLVGLGVVLGVLAIKWLAAFAVPIGIALLVVGSIALIVAIVDDLITLFRGGKSVIGEFLDQVFGLGTADETVKRFTDLWGNLQNALVNVKKYFTSEMLPSIQSGLASMAAWFDATFGRIAEAVAQVTEVVNRAQVRLGFRDVATRATGEFNATRNPTLGASATAAPNVQNSVSVTVQGSSNPAETGRAVAREVDRRLGAQYRQASRQLVPGAG